jgi:hypothetical protein
MEEAPEGNKGMSQWMRRATEWMQVASKRMQGATEGM